MPCSAVNTLGFKSVLLVAVLATAGCGGAESRKARHLEKGETFLAAGNFDKARVEFRNALQIAPMDSGARYENGVVDEKMGNIREAAQFYQGALDSNADNVRARTSLGRIYALSGGSDQALAIVKPGLEKHPDDAGLLTVRAAARIQLKDEAGALADAERAVQLAPNNEDAVAVLAGIYKSQGQIDKSREVLQDAIKRLPSTVELRLALAQLYAASGQEPQVEALLIDLVRLRPDEKAQRLRLAQYYMRSDHNDDAERVLRQGIKDLPAEHELKTGLVQFLAARRSREAAEKELAALIAANPKDFELKFLLAQFYEQGHEDPKAAAVYKGIIDAAELDAPGITARNRWAVMRLREGDVPGGEKLIAEVLAKNPRDNDALILRGNLELAQKDPKSAIVDLRSVLRDQPNSIGVMRALARAHLANGEPALAEETMRRALDANPKDPSVREDLAELLVNLGKPLQAKPIIEELLKQQPDNFAALNIQFKVDAANNDLTGAKQSAEEMASLRPKEALGYYNQAAVAETEKRLEDAVRLYSKALELAPDSLESLQGITRALVGLNRGADAVKRLDAVMSAYPASPFAANLKGGVLLRLQQPADAAVAFKTAIERSPAWAVAYRNLALVQSAAHDIDAAIGTLRLGIGKVDAPAELEGELAGIYEGMGKPDDAIQVYESALQREPKSEFIANNLAMLLVTYKKDRSSLDRAKALTARFANSSNPSYLDTYGWVLYKHGEGSAAVPALQTSLAKLPDSPVLLYHLGMAQAQSGQSEAARDNLSHSLKSGVNFLGMDEAKATLDKLAKLPPSSTALPKS